MDARESQVVHAAALAQILQRLATAFPHLQLQVTQSEFLGDHPVGFFHLFGHLAHRLIEAQAGFHADHHQVERIG